MSRLGLVALLWVGLGAGCGPDSVLEFAGTPTCPKYPTMEAELPPFLLINAYFLQEEAARAARRGEVRSLRVEETFTKARALGATVVRTWGFNDDPGRAGDTAIQTARLEYDELSLRGLDLVLESATRHGLRLILPLGNFWDAYGGARQYVAWAGLDSPVEGDPRFFTEPVVRDHYLEHVGRLLDRVSAVDGVRYGEHPSVLAWELLNEARIDSPRTAQLTGWAEAVAQRIRAHAPTHLIGAGNEGEGAAAFALLAARGVDAASIHLFPEAWGWDPGKIAREGAEWIIRQAEAARGAGRPLWMGEFGLRNSGPLGLQERRAIYRSWLDCARRSGLAGAGPWMFAYDERPDAWDDYTFYLRDGTAPGDPENRYADLLIEAAGAWKGP
ncbi:MAG: cellulase family glycosylhydrolase [Myxococcota bacterium]|nr:cellulase family glycosylhydrolase [Myxococcota bacterium]